MTQARGEPNRTNPVAQSTPSPPLMIASSEKSEPPSVSEPFPPDRTTLPKPATISSPSPPKPADVIEGGVKHDDLIVSAVAIERVGSRCALHVVRAFAGEDAIGAGGPAWVVVVQLVVSGCAVNVSHDLVPQTAHEAGRSAEMPPDEGVRRN